MESTAGTETGARAGEHLAVLSPMAAMQNHDDNAEARADNEAALRTPPQQPRKLGGFDSSQTPTTPEIKRRLGTGLPLPSAKKKLGFGLGASDAPNLQQTILATAIPRGAAAMPMPMSAHFSTSEFHKQMIKHRLKQFTPIRPRISSHSSAALAHAKQMKRAQRQQERQEAERQEAPLAPQPPPAARPAASRKARRSSKAGCNDEVYRAIQGIDAQEVETLLDADIDELLSLVN
mmetsp:Transcript_14732/g.43157  ORF Transcript_14732/g.43157 Transcript_14732/m.43157 type:complete len:234 (-) Transcript_14732:87-788(-)